MGDEKSTFADIDAYIAAQSAEAQLVARALREAIHAAAPGAQERISYDMPTFMLNGRLVYFAVFKKHIGLYGAGSAREAYADELAQYANVKGAYRFPLNQPMPWDLISRVVRLRAAENLAKAGQAD